MRGGAVRVLSVLAAMVFVFTCAFGEDTKTPPPKKPGETIPAGSVLHMKLTTTLTSKTNKSGDPFTGQVSQPIVVDGKEIVPKFSQVIGHVSFVKPSERVKGKALMRLVIDKVVTPDEDKAFLLPSTLDDSNNAPCAHTKDDEGTLEGCGKSKKDALVGAGIAGAMGAGAGAQVGLGHEIECEYYGMCGGHGIGADIGYGAAIGAGTALLYSLLKHEKQLILVQGTELTFIVNRTTVGKDVPPPPPLDQPDQSQISQ
jgi:hypothetical protein